MDNTPRPQVQMSNFTIPHLPSWQPDIFPACAKYAVGECTVKVIMVRSRCKESGVAVFYCLNISFWIDSPTIPNDEDDRPFHCDPTQPVFILATHSTLPTEEETHLLDT